MIRLEKLTLRTLGNIAPNTELHFHDRGALLLGKNGTGKTTLLHVISAVLRSDWPWLFSFAPDGFDLETTVRVATDPETSVRLDVTMSGAPLRTADLWRSPAEVDLHDRCSLTVVLRDSAESRLLAFTSENHRTTFSYADGTTGIREVAMGSPGEGLLFADDVHRSAFDGATRLGEQLVTFGEQLQRYDEAFAYFDRITRDQSSASPLAQRGLMERYSSISGRTWRGDQLSFGQKRLFALLHYLEAHQSIVLADDLASGLHHEWLEPCLELVRPKQSFLASHNLILFDFMFFDSAQDAASRFIECSLDEEGRFVWRNMTLDDATELYEVYQTGIQHVSEILRTRGY